MLLPSVLSYIALRFIFKPFFYWKVHIIKNIGALNREVATVRGFCRVNKSFARYPI